ncbi:alpha-N-acetylgalactosaminide alpha-2,6-sialyltransferase 3-like [Saccoglossus kowalevskii]
MVRTLVVMLSVWKYRPYIALFIGIQAVVLFLYLRFYRLADLTATSQISKRWLRVNVRGKEVLCIPTENESIDSETFTMLCGENENSVINSHMMGSQFENLQLSDPSDLGAVLEGFPNEYLSINNKSVDEKMDFHCDVCALVSTSGHILGTGAGREIDNATCVVRMNASPVKGYEQDVGTRTTLRMVSFITLNSKGLIKRSILEDSSPEKIVLWPTLKKDVYSKVMESYRILSKNYTNIDFYYVSDKQVEYTDSLFERETGKKRIGSGSWLSTGWFTVTLLLYSCDEIRIYGMVESDHCDK